MHLTFEQFSQHKKISLQYVRKVAINNRYAFVIINAERYELVQNGKHTNGSPRYCVVVPDKEVKKRHLSNEEKLAVRNELNAIFAKNKTIDFWQVAKKYGVSYHTIYRVWKEGKTERKKRADAGSKKKEVPPEAMKMFESIIVQNAQRVNVKYAYDIVCRQFHGEVFSLRRFRERAQELKPERLAYHQASKFEQQYTPRIRRDLWAEFEYMDEVTLDGWVVPDRVLKTWGLGKLTNKKFKHNGKDVSFVIIAAKESKTGEVLAFRAFEKSVTADDVLSVLLDVVYSHGRPSRWLLDNGTEFTNEPVQRFLRGLYNTEEHDAKTRIIFSEPYQPYGKGRHERQHKIWKDEFSAFSRSYSPSQRESRKPTRELSYVKPSHTLAEWTEQFEAYLNSVFMERPRVMWMNPDYSPKHEINVDRPKTMREAIARAYQNYEPVKVEAQRLAFLYAKKFRDTLKHGVFKSPAKISPRKLVYLPEGEGIPLNRYHETFEVVVNPTNLFQAWICDLNGNLVCEAWDLRGKNSVNGMEVPNKDIASEYRKKRNKLAKLARESAALKAEVVNLEEVFKPKLPLVKERVEVRDIERTIYEPMQNQNIIEVDSETVEIFEEVYAEEFTTNK